MGKQAEDKDWGAEEESTGFEDVERYKAREGFNDIILILSSCKSTPRHWTGNKYPGQKFYLACLQEGEDAPCCVEFGKPSPSNTVYILHLAEREGDGEWKVLGKPKVWSFGEKTRVHKIGIILRDFCDNDQKKLRKTRLLVTCAGEQFQDISLMAYNKKDIEITSKMKEAIKNKKSMFDEAVTIDEENVMKSLARLRGEEDDSPDSFDTDEIEKPKEEKPKKSKKKAVIEDDVEDEPTEPVEEEVDEGLDDFLDTLDEEEDE